MTDTGTAPTSTTPGGQQIRALPGERQPARTHRHAGLLTLILLIPLGMIGGVIADRPLRGRGDEERQRGVGRPADLRRPDDRGALSPSDADIGDERRAHAAARQALDRRQHPAAAAAARSVHRQRLYRHTRRHGRVPDQALRELAADNRQIDWSAARVEIGLSNSHSSRATARHRRPEGRLGVRHGQRLVVAEGGDRPGMADRAGHGPVRFRITLAGSGKLGLVPLGQRYRGDACRALARAQLLRAAAAEPDRRQGRFPRAVVGLGPRPPLQPVVGQRQRAQRPDGEDGPRIRPSASPC